MTLHIRHVVVRGLHGAELDSNMPLNTVRVTKSNTVLLQLLRRITVRATPTLCEKALFLGILVSINPLESRSIQIGQDHIHYEL